MPPTEERRQCHHCLMPLVRDREPDWAHHSWWVTHTRVLSSPKSSGKIWIGEGKSWSSSEPVLAPAQLPGAVHPRDCWASQLEMKALAFIFHCSLLCASVWDLTRRRGYLAGRFGLPRATVEMPGIISLSNSIQSHFSHQLPSIAHMPYSP